MIGTDDIGLEVGDDVMHMTQCSLLLTVIEVS
jgi:hypothetical protein